MILRINSATAQDDSYVYMLKKIKKEGESSPGVIRMRKADGTVVDEIILNQKEPEYLLDTIKDRLIVKMHGTKLACYEFEK